MKFLKQMWRKNSRHKKLEELVLQNCKEGEDEIEIENDVVTFKLKYLGSTVVEKVNTNENISVEAVKSILKTVKLSRKKIPRANVHISLKGIVVTDLLGNDLLKVSIYRISNCSTDASHRQVFSFISTDPQETNECHAFLCSKAKTAASVTLAVGHAFNSAYEAWKIMPSSSSSHSVEVEVEVETHASTQEMQNEQIKNIIEERKNLENIIMDQLIDLSGEEAEETSNDSFGAVESGIQNFNQWVSFEDDFSAISQRHQTNNKQVDLILV